MHAYKLRHAYSLRLGFELDIAFPPNIPQYIVVCVLPSAIDCPLSPSVCFLTLIDLRPRICHRAVLSMIYVVSFVPVPCRTEYDFCHILYPSAKVLPWAGGTERRRGVL